MDIKEVTRMVEQNHIIRLQSAQTDLHSIIQCFMDNFNIEFIELSVIGYTPQWNDGETCDHRTQVDLNNGDGEYIRHDVYSDYTDLMIKVLESMYGTNFELIVKADGSYSINPNYDCGW